MLDLQKDWSISFAGCGFMGIYYVGASSCILERSPRFIQDASKIYGASAGALMAAVLAVGIPLENCCADLMFMAKEGRKHKLGPLHPAYNLVQIVQDSLRGGLPEDAHVRASGKLCVSLTRVSDGKNVLVSEFDSREELIQVLVCSCFVPFYCGVIPPTYRGVHYVDGAVSDNLPQCHLKNTITFSAYAGESDLCPRGSTFNFHEVRFNNVSIQVNSENMYRVTSTFFPPQPEGSEDQLKEVWQESDGLDPDNFDPKTFFKMHDSNGDGFFDESELEALFTKELEKVYNPENEEDDMVEMEEERLRMREHVMNEVDTDKDRLVSLAEFMAATKKEEFLEKDEWETLEQNPLYSEDELKQYEQHLVNEENDINKKSVELQKQREELERKQEELNAQKFGLQQAVEQMERIKAEAKQPGAAVAGGEPAPVVPGNSQPLPPAHQQQDVPVPGHS